MVHSRELAARFEAYADWRQRLSQRICALRGWLAEQGLADAQIELKIEELLERLREDKLIVAFVAEFSRGKSELINAIFFADFGQRLLPSSAGRTTMCPTELLHDGSLPPSIRLLPIETRGRDGTVTELKRYPDEWVTLPLDLASAERMSAALASVSQVKSVSVGLARHYGLYEDDEPLPPADDDRHVDIPAWRHAIINVPHPLLQQGLVVLDTPGLNAVGTEPELTLSLLPSAHAVLFVLAADAGVTKSDLEIWNRNLASGDDERKGRLAILNKIDGLWDALKAPVEIEAEIARQLEDTARLLRVPADQVFAVSAQKALLAKINGDDGLLARSRLPALEDALVRNLIPAKREIVGDAIHAEVRALAAGVRALLAMRQARVGEQLNELEALRGKNQDVVLHMMDRVRAEKELFERGLSRYTALRNVMTAETNALFEHIGLETLRATAMSTRRAIEASPFTHGVRGAMSAFFTTIRGDFAKAATRATSVHELMCAMHSRFAAENATEAFAPPVFSLLRYQKEIDRLERAYNLHFNTLWNMLSHAKFALMRRFFETVAARVRHVYTIANRDLEAWVKAVMAPLETQVREHHLQLKRRLESIRRIHRTSGEFEERIAELQAAQASIAAEIAGFARELAAIDAVIETPEALPVAANG